VDATIESIATCGHIAKRASPVKRFQLGLHLVDLGLLRRHENEGEQTWRANGRGRRFLARPPVVLEFGEQREHYPRRLAKSRYAKYLSLEQRAHRVIIAGERAFEWGKLETAAVE